MRVPATITPIAPLIARRQRILLAGKTMDRLVKPTGQIDERRSRRPQINTHNIGDDERMGADIDQKRRATHEGGQRIFEHRRMLGRKVPASAGETLGVAHAPGEAFGELPMVNGQEIDRKLA